MATNSTAQYYVHPSGNDTNGGGFDSGISGAGTNYADQDTAQLALTGLTCAQNGTQLTATNGTFNSSHVGNAIQITAGTNFLLDIYWVTGYDATNGAYVTLDRTPCTAGAGSAGTGNLGGALATLKCLSNGGSGLPSNPLNTKTQIVAGNIINVKGSGSLDPSISSPDYDFSAGYWQFPNGTSTKPIQFIGYNGRPCVKFSGLLFYTMTGVILTHFKWFAASPPVYTVYGVAYGGAISAATLCTDSIFDQNGQDCTMWGASNLYNCEFRNSGSTTTGTRMSILSNAFPLVIIGCYIHSQRFNAIDSGSGTTGEFTLISCNLIVNNKGAGLILQSSQSYGVTVLNNTIDGNTGDGIKIASNNTCASPTILNNILSNNGGYGIDATVGSTSLFAALPIDYNCFYNNTSGARNGINAGPHDQTNVNPQYANSASGNYAVGNASLQGVGFPGTLSGSGSTGYLTPGAIQPSASGGSSGPFGLLSTTLIAPQ